MPPLPQKMDKMNNAGNRSHRTSPPLLGLELVADSLNRCGPDLAHPDLTAKDIQTTTKLWLNSRWSNWSCFTCTIIFFATDWSYTNHPETPWNAAPLWPSKLAQVPEWQVSALFHWHAVCRSVLSLWQKAAHWFPSNCTLNAQFYLAMTYCISWWNNKQFRNRKCLKQLTNVKHQRHLLS